MDPSWWNAMWSVSQCLSVLPGFELLVIGNLPYGTSSPKRCRRLSRFEATQKTSLANIKVEPLKVMWMSKRCKCCLIVTGKSLSINIYLFYIIYIPLKIWDVHLKRDHFSKGSCHWSKHHFLRESVAEFPGGVSPIKINHQLRLLHLLRLQRCSVMFSQTFFAGDDKATSLG